MTDKKIKQEVIDRLKGDMTYQIEIAIKGYDEGYDLFEKIQNDYSIYDNCVIETNEKNCVIKIEGKNKIQIKDLAKELSKKYPIKPKVVQVPIRDTIVDEGRDEETGGFEV